MTSEGPVERMASQDTDPVIQSVPEMTAQPQSIQHTQQQTEWTAPSAVESTPQVVQTILSAPPTPSLSVTNIASIIVGSMVGGIILISTFFMCWRGRLLRFRRKAQNTSYGSPDVEAGTTRSSSVEDHHAGHSHGLGALGVRLNQGARGARGAAGATGLTAATSGGSAGGASAGSPSAH
ncbi:hypothetical protein F4781DRAFT_404043 [Annulohypoxylon bovei var. microspora]|nr:hypothetical protein F4781DRAFT_404043 [Annulohypoxylon bovei var. microspora]